MLHNEWDGSGSQTKGGVHYHILSEGNPTRFETFEVGTDPQEASIHAYELFLLAALSAQQDQQPHDDRGTRQKTCTTAHSQNQVSASICELLSKEREPVILCVDVFYP